MSRHMGAAALVVGFATQVACAGADTCLQFNGSSGRVVVGNSAGINFSGPFTLEAWINPTRITGANQDIVLKWSFSSGYSGQRSYFLQINTGALHGKVSLDGTNNTGASAAGTGLTIGEWQHVAGVFDGVSMSVFINGARVASTPSTGPGPHYPGFSPVNIGGQNSPTFEPFSGYIDEVRVSDIARYTSNFVPSTVEFEPDEHTAILAHFDEGVGSITDNAGLQGSDCVIDPGVVWATGSPIQSAPPPCPGDINGDGLTNSADFSILAGWFGLAVPPGPNGDLNRDGHVDALDFVILAGDFGCTGDTR